MSSAVSSSQVSPALGHRRRMSKPQGQPAAPPPLSPAESGDSSDLSLDVDPGDGDEPDDGLSFELDPTFQREPTSDVRIICGRHTFWAHGAFLRFSSDWFASIIEGDWAESQPSADTDSVVFQLPPGPTPSSPPTSPSPTDADVSGLQLSSPAASTSSPTGSPHQTTRDWARKASEETFIQLPQDEIRVRRGIGRSYITVTLPSSEAAPLHDYLHHVYPHLTLRVTWLTVEPLVHFATKYQIPSLLPILTIFLTTHAPGRPIAALALAETLALPDLYQEASRYVLDQLPNWPENEYMILGGETRWKLEKRRGYFLDRVLKMGLVEVEKDYICHASCPHPSQCAHQLDEKFRAAYAASFRYGAPQPSVIFRNLRCLSLPPSFFILPQTLCNETAKSWLANLFDRMFEIPLHATEGSRGRFFLTIKLASD